jgi:hypothetical protein
MYRKFVSALLLLLFIINCTISALLSLVLLEMHRDYRKSVNDGDSKQLVEIRLNRETAAVFLHRSELEWNGKRFDVLRVSHSGETLILSCIPDTEEDELLGQLQKSAGDPDADRNLKHQLTKKFATEYLPVFTALPCQAFISCSAVQRAAGMTAEGFFSPDAPPPWQA